MGEYSLRRIFYNYVTRMKWHVRGQWIRRQVKRKCGGGRKSGDGYAAAKLLPCLRQGQEMIPVMPMDTIHLPQF